MAVPTITPFLWFDDQAEDAARFYVSIFPGSRIIDVARARGAGGDGEDPVLTVRFSLDGHEFVALNGGPVHYGFDESISFVIECKDDVELDHYWSALGEGGAEIACGWLKDRFGLRWQVVPAGLSEVLGDPDPARAKRAMDAMMTMTKLDLHAMRRAADGGDRLGDPRSGATTTDRSAALPRRGGCGVLGSTSALQAPRDASRGATSCRPLARRPSPDRGGSAVRQV